MMEFYYDLSAEFDLTDVNCELSIQSERSQATPYSYGGSRGYETVITGARLEKMTLGNLALTRDMAVDVFGNAVISAIETKAFDLATHD